MARGPRCTCGDCATCSKREQRHDYYLRTRERVLAQAADYRAANAEKIRSQQTVWRLANKDSLKRRNFEKQYGISWAERMQMLEEQGGVCAICQSDDPKAKDWHMDHDHACCPEKATSCGQCVRGLLCSRCNIAIGCFDDDPRTLQAAIEYVSRMRPAAG